MIFSATRATSVLLAALTPPSIVVVVQGGGGSHDEGCSGCTADFKVHQFKASNPNGTGWIWEGGAGSLVTSVPANVKDKDGYCKRKPAEEGQPDPKECEPKADHPCEAGGEVTVTNIGALSYVNGEAFNCVGWAQATAENKKLSAYTDGCNTSADDWFEAHVNTNCNIGPNSERVKIVATCEACKYIGT